MDLSPWLSKSMNGAADDSPESEYALAQTLLDAGVGLHPREEHAERPGYFRLVFSQPREVLEEGLRRSVAI